MLTASQDGSNVLQPVKQKVRVYNPRLLSELLHEAERAKQQHSQVCHGGLKVKTAVGCCNKCSV